ncbi:MAG TPA: LacI family DNA-binding transcriptional regulator [Roseiflexaceae bacterium]|nr:LacI family DNA-binding transcriptional regulator [Roseiflexaceae bacterium]
MARRSVSIIDIARAAGVASSTVSRALRDSPLISADVRTQIQRLAQEMGYTPNGIAQSLQTRRTNTVGLVVPSIADPFFGDVMRGVEEVARPAGLSIFLSAGHNDARQEAEAIETFHRRRVDGILVASSRLSDGTIQLLERVRVPIVLVNSNAEARHELLHAVAVDDHHGARLAVEHLLALGHRAIGYLGAGNRPGANARRLAGYRATLAAAGVPPHDAWVAIAPVEDALSVDDVAAGQALLHPLLVAGVTAVFCFNDMVATGVLIACRELGLAVPRDMSVVGYDDIDFARYVTPALTTVRQPKLELGRLGMQMLLELLSDRPAQSQVLLPELVERASTAEISGPRP